MDIADPSGLFILDGATATNLMRCGMPRGECVEKWITAHPDVLIELQRAYAEAGSMAVLAPTFGLNRINLTKHGVDRALIPSMAKELVGISRQAVAGKGIYVGGDMSPLGLFLPPIGESSFDELVEIFSEQACALEAAGVDFFMLETFSSITEIRAALLAVREASAKPVFVSMTFDGEGRTSMGTDLLTALVTVQSMGADGFGMNCSPDLPEMYELLCEVTPYAAIPVIAKPGAGLPEADGGGDACPLSPEEFAEYGKKLADIGVSVIGGCCGTTPEHIRALCELVEKEDIQPATPLRPVEYGSILATTETETFFLDPTVDFSEPVGCSADMGEDIMQAEDSPMSVLKLRIEGPEDVHFFENNMFLVKYPLCIESSDPELLEHAARVWNGRLIIDPEADLSDETVERLKSKYGAITL